uniref:Ig-like domain-containing protein n=1 Tax=Haplochromis burtoni TaxID=8153 RepID=A0A3Q2X3Z9_HAPBU
MIDLMRFSLTIAHLFAAVFYFSYHTKSSLFLGQSEVIGPPQTVVALIGDDIILPCNLDPVMDALDMAVEWARPDLNPRFVLVWRDSVELESKKHPSYTNRTSLFTDELKNGNISLKISKVKLSDKGTYRCFVPELKRQTTVKLVVGAASSPAAEINKSISGVVLQCESAGWYPEPELLWLDGEGNLLSAGPTETLRVSSLSLTYIFTHPAEINKLIFCISLFLLLSTAESQVVGPHQPVVALVDDDVILPCHVEPAEDVSAQILEWTRSDLNPRFVHVWRSGQDLVNTRNPSYRGRTSLFINELKHGNISLKLSRVKLSDKGTYECSIPLMGKNYFVKLAVGNFSGIDKNRGGVVLQCESAGWYPEPELLWLDGEGNLLSAGPTETLRGPDDLYTVSSRVTVEKRHSNNITCRSSSRCTGCDQLIWATSALRITLRVTLCKLNSTRRSRCLTSLLD